MYVCGFIRKGWVWEINEESSFKNWISEFRDWLASSLRKATREKAMCGAHDWKIKSRARLSFLWLSRKKCQTTKDPQKSLFGKKLCLLVSQEMPNCKRPTKVSVWQKVVFALLCLYPHYIYPYYPQIMSAFHRENPRQYIWELEIVIPTII